MDQDTTNKKAAGGPLGLRTYEADLSQEIANKGATLSTIVAAEHVRNEAAVALETATPAAPPNYTRILIIAAISIVLMLAGGGLLAYTYLLQPQTVAVAPNTPSNSIIYPNKSIAIAYDGERQFTAVLGTARTDAALPLGEIARFDITFAKDASSTSAALLTALGVPDALRREVKQLVVGVHAFNRTQPFIVMEVSQYDRAYAAMLGWEEDMGRTLGALYRPLNGTTPPTTLFTDAVYRNIDTRISQEAWPIVYAFPRKNILVITTNNQTLQEIMTRINAAPRGTSR